MSWRNLKTVAIAALIWIISSAAIFIGARQFFFPERLTRLSESGQRTVARVVAKDEEHMRMDYEYSVGTKTYRGSGPPGRGNALFKELSVGSSVYVTYDPSVPEDSFLGIPEMELEMSFLMLRFVSVVVPFFPIVTVLIILLALSRAKA